ncbi:MAG: hypothetical protein HY521_05095 [Proteobacteria bacterium]|nr:hypothetical protein [Pseudomonadota bacterium]
MRSLMVALLALTLGVAFVAGPALADTKAEALKKCEAIKDKAKNAECVKKANAMK